ncbi:alpha/beta hydrolase family esterase [Streptomyces yanii]|uniref:Alpha/beta hydrolase family esterase n=1 Tax=Streptomyces yanii TaxID=78510 RepID=A0ABV5R912_9ACTN
MTNTRRQRPHIRRWSALAISVALIALGLAAGPAAAATAPAATGGDHNLSLTWQGKDRTFKLHTPPGYTPGKKLPLVVVMHWYPGTAEGIEAYTGFSKRADSHNFLVAYPQGLDGGYNALVCCGSEDDVGFITAMVGRLVDGWDANPSRVYATGFSNGADMSFRLAVERSGVFAAVAPVSGGYTGPLTEDPGYVPSRPVPVITIVGSKDLGSPYFQAGIATWRERLGCVTTDQVNKPGEYTAIMSRCADGSRVHSYVIEGMGHEWPDDADYALNATDVVWKFLKKYKRH